jgi:hypothetical protein
LRACCVVRGLGRRGGCARGIRRNVGQAWGAVHIAARGVIHRALRLRGGGRDEREHGGRHDEALLHDHPLAHVASQLRRK